MLLRGYIQGLLWLLSAEKARSGREWKTFSLGIVTLKFIQVVIRLEIDSLHLLFCFNGVHPTEINQRF